MDTVVNTIFPFLTVVIGAACIFQYISTKTLRDSRDDQEKRIIFLEAKSVRDDTTIAKQEAAFEVLRQTVTGEAYLVAISDVVEHVSKDLNEHHKSAVAEWVEIRGVLTHMDGTMTALQVALAERGGAA